MILGSSAHVIKRDSVFHISHAHSGPFAFLCGNVTSPLGTVDYEVATRLPAELLCPKCSKQLDLELHSNARTLAKCAGTS